MFGCIVNFLAAQPNRSITALLIPEQTGPNALANPISQEKDFRDYILINPYGDFEPIYIYIRNQPRQVTGKGQKIHGTWLADADKGNGAAIPSQIADKLRGKTFNNFDAFRKAFWIEVSKDPELAGQFIISNQDRMSKGLSAKARKVDSLGKRRSFEIHHKEPISQGGDVYNIDNMAIITPKKHMDIHTGN